MSPNFANSNLYVLCYLLMKGKFVSEILGLSQRSREFDNQIVKNIPFLNHIAAKYVNNIEDKEDLIQETIYKALKNRRKFKANSNIKGWLTTVLKNTYINQYHKKKSYKEIVNIESVNIPYEDINDVTIEKKQDNLNVTKSTSSKNIYWEALNRLSLECKLLILMSDIEGFSYNQISEFLNCSVGTIRSRLYRSRKMMVKNYKKLSLSDKY